MILWFTISAITLSVVIFLLIPLLRKQTDATTRVDYDIAVYRDQLAEIDKDIERELLTPEEADPPALKFNAECSRARSENGNAAEQTRIAR